MRDIGSPKIIRTIEDLTKQHEELLKTGDTWIFRGEGFRREKEKSWELSPSLERIANKFEKSAPELEHYLLREFQRRYHHYSPNSPEIWDKAEWLALMQHHGAPTRLLDWTYSPFVAAFFAMQQAAESPYEDSVPMVWCCNSTWLAKRAMEILQDNGVRLPPSDDPFRQDGNRESAERLENIFQIGTLKPIDYSFKFVYPVNSFRLNQRLTIQQGVFLAPCGLSRSFHSSLMSMKPLGGPFRWWKFDRGQKNKGFKELARRFNRMNLTEAVLFPGLDGFSRSLKLSWRIVGR